MRKPVLSLALVLILTAGGMIFGADHQSSGSSNSGSASQNSGSSSTSKNSNTKTQDRIDDKALAGNINQLFAADQIFSTSGILAESKNGIVTLRGSLSSEAEMDRAVEMTKGVNGVQSVDSQLVVGNPNPHTTTPNNQPSGNATTGNVDSKAPGNSPDTNSSALTTEDKSRRNDPTANGNSMTPSNDSITGDTQISKQIDAQLKADKHLTANQVTAEVVNGNVVLRGKVSDKAEETRIIDMVKQTKGVTSVRSMLVLENANPK